ncbi:MAG TPA: radical SAM protein [Adlercreutzia equolifaciens]|uniref:4Fe-4S single cluster domain-containing protein n=1 Tax=Adlercreutzia equolifaciens TaxID=446660 RepID=UPI00242ED426|nr:4Fe-4S single cluster domain-containing protein [Adlercreutzia equolifaciens]HJI12936.1 radical SAM protein [Adlercreutzia equolifaciens]
MAAMENDFENATISLYGTVPDSIVDGPGLRYAVFVQGCSHHCPGCHNPESQPAEGGTETTLAALLADIRANGLAHDVTLSGGEPFEQPKACAALAAELKRNGYGIWCYTGYLYDDLAGRAEAARTQQAQREEAGLTGNALTEGIADDLAVGDLLDSIDVLVDGPFAESRKSLELKWCGSSNQRLIDVPATRRAGSVVEWQPTSFSLEKPSNW